MIRILHELSALDGGGVAKLLEYYYEKFDKNVFHFDFLIYDFYEKGALEDKFRALGCQIFRIEKKGKTRRQIVKSIEEVFKNYHFDIVHSHLGNRGLYTLNIARHYGVKIRIAHSHIAFEKVSSFLMVLKNKLASFFTKKVSTDLFACGSDAAKYMWGRDSKKQDVFIMPNAIPVQHYKFDANCRIKIRKELGLESKKVLCAVGRLSDQKNYPFLFQVMKTLTSHDNNYHLVIAGRGLQEDKIRKLCDEMKLNKCVTFLGLRNDVANILSASDLYLMTSYYEGLPVVLIEAQANGIPILCSNRVTREMDVLQQIEFLPICAEDIDKWCSSIVANPKHHNQANYEQILKSNYNIDNAVLILQNKYFDLVDLLK